MLNTVSLTVLLKGLFLFAALATHSANAAEAIPSGPVTQPRVAPASNEGELAIKRFVLPRGFKAELIAAEPNLANPVAFTFDEKGRIYVAETFRLHAGVTDIRGHMNWLDEDLAARTADDRLALMKRHAGVRIGDYAKSSDRVKLLVDRDGDGKIDSSTVFADGFNSVLDGLGSGVLARKGDVWFSNVPNLWHLRDDDGDGKAEQRRSLHYGFGVRVGFLGHDLHGLTWGPDGKIYFSIGDRGSNISLAGGRRVGDPDSGCVFRCDPDGSELEVFAFGLRNPQELAFDKYGNLFTGDNNSDGGDRARWVHLIEGSDSGWRIGFQFIQQPNSRGPWNSEKMWHPQWDGQAAFLVPPLTNITDGPSGLAYAPGTGMPARYADHFFLADFHGGKGSGIVSFGLKPRGASFEVVDLHRFLWEGLPTDVEFGPDGGVYYSDWVEGWGMTGKGRIYRVFDPDAVKDPVVGETKRLLAEGCEKKPNKQLVQLLGHADMRVRREAQFELASRGTDSIGTLAAAARKDSRQLARVHAIWALGQISSKFKVQSSNFGNGVEAIEPLVGLLADADPEIRAQAAKVLGDQRAPAAFDGLVKLTRDSEPRVRLFATMAVGKLGRKEAIPAVLAVLRDNADRDPHLRHACVMALTWIGDVDALLDVAGDSSSAVRMGVLLALRRLDRAEIAHFLDDSEPRLVAEAARAINDIPISGAMPQLATLAGRASDIAKFAEPFRIPTLRRVVNANYRVGLAETAKTLARLAAQQDLPDLVRGEALADLASWPEPGGRDRITSLWRPTAFTRDASDAGGALRPELTGILQSAPDFVRAAAANAAQRLKINEAAPVLAQLVQGNGTVSAQVKVASLRALAGLSDSLLAEALKQAHSDSNEEVRKEAVRLQASLKPAGVVDRLAGLLETGSLGEKQNAFATLATIDDAAADELVSTWLGKLSKGDVPKELQLDVLEAAAKRPGAQVKAALEKYVAAQPKDDPIAGFRETLVGGDAAEGRRIFFERPEAACLRCHKVNGEGGEVGPDLTGIGAKQSREYLLESMIFPNRKIAENFETLVISLKDGAAYAGIVKKENDKELELNSPEDGLVTIAKADIVSRARGLSAMPEGMTNILTRQELRNVVEFLANLK